MFTGIIEELAQVQLLSKGGRGARLAVLAPKVSAEIQPGQSISVNGVCLTAVNIERNLLKFDLMQETLKCTNLNLLKAGDRVNLERALKADARIDGHFVYGHIDATGVIKSRVKKGTDSLLTVSAAEEILGQIVPKGSVALDGISLTICAQGPDWFQVSLIPYTLEHTTLGLKGEQDLVNIECDILGKYVAKQLNPASKVDLTFLAEHGFI